MSQAPSKNVFLFLFHYHLKQLTITLPKSHQPLTVDHIKVKYVRKRVLGPKCPNMVIRPHAPYKIDFIFLFFSLSLEAIYKYATTELSTTICRSF